MFAGKKSAQIREILISESAWEEMTCLFAPSLRVEILTDFIEEFFINNAGTLCFFTFLRFRLRRLCIVQYTFRCTLRATLIMCIVQYIFSVLPRSIQCHLKPFGCYRKAVFAVEDFSNFMPR